MTRKITLPLIFKKYADHYAELTCDLNEIGPGDKNYKKEYTRAFSKFCEEAYLHSLSPLGVIGGNLKANPTTKKITKSAMDTFDIYKEGGLIKAISKISINKEEERLLINHLKSSIMSLTNLILITSFGVNTSGDAGHTSDLDYTYKEGDLDFASMLDNEKDLSTEDRKSHSAVLRAETCRYIRYGVFAQVTAMITLYIKNLSGDNSSARKRITEHMPNSTDHNNKGLRFNLGMLKKSINRKKFTIRSYDDVINGTLKLTE